MRLIFPLLITFLCFIALPISAHDAQGPGAEMIDLYQHGKVNQAREQFKKDFVALTEMASKPFDPRHALDAETYVSSLGIAMNVTKVALAQERRHVKSATAPDIVLDHASRLSKMASKMKAAVDSSKYKGQDRVMKAVEYADSQHVGMMTEALILNRNLGRIEVSKKIAADHKALFDDHEVPLDALVVDQEDGQEVPIRSVSEAPGILLPIADRIFDFYQALVAEDAAALDLLLAKGRGFLTGQQLVASLQREREREGDFDRLLPPIIDGKTTFALQEVQENTYVVRLSGVIKRVLLKGEEIKQRESDTFLVIRDEDNNYFIVVKGMQDE